MSWPAALASGPDCPQPVIRAIDDALVARQHHVGAEAEPLHHAGPIAFDQRVGAFEQLQHVRDAGLVLQIAGDLPAAAHHDDAAQALLLLADASSVTTSAPMSASIIGRERAGPEAGEFDDANAGERSGGAGGGCEWFVEVCTLVSESARRRSLLATANACRSDASVLGDDARKCRRRASLRAVHDRRRFSRRRRPRAAPSP